MAKIWREKDRLGPCLATRESRNFLPESLRLILERESKKDCLEKIINGRDMARKRSTRTVSSNKRNQNFST
ncbi:MAG: hypothetical protein F6K40_24020 [Okeania sp. SIO3I5]|uniref:hypothetical protein n=1 Tax=Okeania sp. SIO3I5 TaxID=2607805 RepID=UPI0013B7D7E3|nr:hypothetical protein [Okeania sp. SIO3I5]NEQ39152.1 hypothetical protein [Okeania sp. SIO3I5]